MRLEPFAPVLVLAAAELKAVADVDRAIGEPWRIGLPVQQYRDQVASPELWAGSGPAW